MSIYLHFTLRKIIHKKQIYKITPIKFFDGSFNKPCVSFSVVPDLT